MPNNNGNGDNSSERRKGMDDFARILNELKEQQKFISDAHLSCRAETRTELKFVNESVKSLIRSQNDIVSKINDVNITLNSKINGVDKQLSIKDQDLDGRIKQISTKRSAVVGSGAAGGAVIAWEIIKFLWEKLKTFI